MKLKGRTFSYVKSLIRMESDFQIDENHIITNNSFISGFSDDDALQKLHSVLVDTEEKNENKTQTLAILMHELFPRNEGLLSEKYHPLATIISIIIKNLSDPERETLIEKLIPHVGIYNDGYPWIDFEAAWLLNLSTDLWKPKVFCPLPDIPPLQANIKYALAEGRYIPMQHIIHALHLAQFHPLITEYPFNITQVVPKDFLNKINRSDVLRSFNAHMMLLSTNFPLMGCRFPRIYETLYNYMFIQRYSALAGMEVYNEFFFESSRQLGRGIVPPIGEIPKSLLDKVSSKYKRLT